MNARKLRGIAWTLLNRQELEARILELEKVISRMRDESERMAFEASHEWGETDPDAVFLVEIEGLGFFAVDREEARKLSTTEPMEG